MFKRSVPSCILYTILRNRNNLCYQFKSSTFTKSSLEYGIQATFEHNVLLTLSWVSRLKETRRRRRFCFLYGSRQTANTFKEVYKISFHKDGKSNCFSANVQANGRERGSKQRPILGCYLHTYQPIRQQVNGIHLSRVRTRPVSPSNRTSRTTVTIVIESLGENFLALASGIDPY